MKQKWARQKVAIFYEFRKEKKTDAQNFNFASKFLPNGGFQVKILHFWTKGGFCGRLRCRCILVCRLRFTSRIQTLIRVATPANIKVEF